MAKPLVMEIPHELGRDEARRRIEEGTGRAREFLQRSGVAVETLAWTGDTLNYAVSSLGQRVEGQIDVTQEIVRVETRLPLILSLFADKVRKMVSKEGNLMLTKT